MSTALPLADLHRLKWRSRRGLLECDLFVKRFFENHGASITRVQADGLTRLMNLDDPQLLDLLLKRSEPSDELDRDDVHSVLSLMRVN
jgi:antitoxin CptB